ncbi:hypothetical protein ES705_42408 [subsurface metagenome]
MSRFAGAGSAHELGSSSMLWISIARFSVLLVGVGICISAYVFATVCNISALRNSMNGPFAILLFSNGYIDFPIYVGSDM